VLSSERHDVHDAPGHGDVTWAVAASTAPATPAARPSGRVLRRSGNHVTFLLPASPPPLPPLPHEHEAAGAGASAAVGRNRSHSPSLTPIRGSSDGGTPGWHGWRFVASLSKAPAVADWPNASPGHAACAPAGVSYPWLSSPAHPQPVIARGRSAPAALDSSPATAAWARVPGARMTDTTVTDTSAAYSQSGGHNDSSAVGAPHGDWLQLSRASVAPAATPQLAGPHSAEAPSTRSSFRSWARGSPGDCWDTGARRFTGVNTSGGPHLLSPCVPLGGWAREGVDAYRTGGGGGSSSSNTPGVSLQAAMRAADAAGVSHPGSRAECAALLMHGRLPPSPYARAAGANGSRGGP
jgi:hypothetical protein